MVTGDSPAGARRRVRLAIREARESSGFTQAQVAEEMEWSLSKVMRIESGEVTITPNDLRPLLMYLGIADRVVIDRMTNDARISRRRAMWWDEPRFRDHLTPSFRQLVQYEAEATELRHYHAYTVSGVLQTRAYADAILGQFDLPPATAEARAEARERSRAQLMDRLGQIDFRLIIDEAVLRRRAAVRSAEVLGNQLAELLDLIRRGRITLRILHFEASVPPPMYGSFELLRLPGEGRDLILYRESHLMDEIVEDETNVRRHEEIFEELWVGSLPEAESMVLLEDAVKALGGMSPPASTTTGRRQPKRREKSATD